MLQMAYKGQYLNARVDRPQELDTSFIAEDGLKRNLLKFYWEWHWSHHWALENPASHGWIFTKMLNCLVELFRHAPYLWGHVFFIIGGIQALVGVAAICSTFL
jgi:hypothetical protein